MQDEFQARVERLGAFYVEVEDGMKLYPYEEFIDILNRVGCNVLEDPCQLDLFDGEGWVIFPPSKIRERILLCRVAGLSNDVPLEVLRDKFLDMGDSALVNIVEEHIQREKVGEKV